MVATLQEKMMAGPSRPRFTGWLTMAPEVDPAPTATPASISTTLAEQGQASGSSRTFSSSTSSEQPTASTHGFGYLGQNVKLPQRKKRRATFQIGSPGLSEDETEGSTSGRSSSASSDAPDFDVRASFAPMPVWGKPQPTAQPPTYRGVGDGNYATFAAQSSGLHPNDKPAANAADSSSDEDADGLSFGGRRWKGKTVHAVEQELEALRDERLMSHAPDATYLASRLEGVRRNLEIEERRPSYVPYDEDMLADEEEAALAPDASQAVRQLYLFQQGAGPHRPVSNASSVSLVEGETPHDFDFDLQFERSASHTIPFDQIKVHDPDEVCMPPVSTLLAPSSAKPIDPAARAAALDARIEVRPLRRGDLEQVRDLHAFHGDSDRSPVHGETYASTASFLLRLLVDDRHVCLVAVAKPIPEPSAPLPDLVSSRANISVPDSPRSADNASSGAASPLSSSPSIDGLESLNLATASVAAHDDDDDDDEDDDEEEEQSSLSSSPGPPSLFSISKGDGVPAAPHTRMINPRGRDGRINNTPATSVFSDIFAERGHPPSSLNKHALPGPTEPAPVRKVLNVPPPRSLSSDSKPVETETILGVVSAQLTVVTAPSEDSLFSSFKKGGGEGDKGGGEEATGVIDIHLLTLATSPEERGQGLGAKLLSALHGECMIKARHMALRMRSQIPGITIPHVSPLSPKFIDEPTTATVMTSQVASTSCSTSNASTVGGLKASEVIAAMRCSSYLRTLGGVEWTLAELKDPIAAPIGKYLTRMYLEVHPSNIHALALYRAHGFVAPNDDSKAVKRGFYRGDLRIATAERTKRGGTDAWILQRFDGALST